MALFLALAPVSLLAETDHGVVTLSTGEQVEGEFSATPGRKLELFDVIKSKRYQFDASELVRISASVEQEKLEQAWMFKEESDRTKLKLPYKYPLRTLLSDVTLTSGDTLHGHVAFVFYLDKDDTRQRFFINWQQKGEKDQALADLIYVKELVLTQRKAAGKGTGQIQIKGQAAVVSLDREVSYQPPFTAVLSGKYDAYIFEGAKIRYGLSGDPLTAAELKALDEKVQITEEFFPHRRVVAAAKNGKLARALMELTRPEGSHDQGWKYARWELWTFEPRGEGWDIRKRLFLYRDRIPDTKDLPRYEYVPEDKLKSVSENAVLE